MGIELKTKTRFSSYNLIYSLSRVFRVIGWFISCATVGYSIPYFISRYNELSMTSWYADHAFEMASSATLTLIICGLVTGASLFLLSLALYTGLALLGQRRTQLALLERLVRERREKLSSSNVIALIENL